MKPAKKPTIKSVQPLAKAEAQTRGAELRVKLAGVMPLDKNYFLKFPRNLLIEYDKRFLPGSEPGANVVRNMLFGLRKGGASLDEAVSAFREGGFGAVPMLFAGVSVETLFRAGYTAKQIDEAIIKAEQPSGAWNKKLHNLSLLESREFARKARRAFNEASERRAKQK